MKRFVGLLVLIVLQLGTAVGWLAYGTGRQVSGEVGSWEQIQELSPEEKQMQKRLALWYDLNLNNAGEGAPLEGYEQIMFFEDGLMCCVEFSQAQKILPVWHGAREKPTGGLTHFSRSSLPVGGKGNHTVLTCREKDLGDMTLPECGDELIVHVLGDAITYRVRDVLRARGELAAPEGDANKDLCSIWVRRGAGWVIIQAEREDAKVEKGENIG